MKAARINKFLECVGTKGLGGEKRIRASCPLAPYTHYKGTDEHPSFGVFVGDDHTSTYHCYTCGHSGTLVDLVFMLRMYRKTQGTKGIAVNFNLAIQLAEEEGDSPDFDFRDYDDLDDMMPEKVIFPPEWLGTFRDPYKIPRAARYLKERRVPRRVAEEIGILYDPAERRLVFPMFDSHGDLIGAQGRDITGRSRLRYKAYDYKGEYNTDFWLGESKLDIDAPVVLTEGPFDYAQIYAAYPNVLASCGGISFSKLRHISDVMRVWTFFDFGTGGDTARKKVHDYFRGTGVPIKNVLVPEKIGDAGNCSSSQMRVYLKKLIDIRR